MTDLPDDLELIDELSEEFDEPIDETIDWLSVENVVRFGYSMKLTKDEQLMAIRRLADRMSAAGEWNCYAETLSAAEVGRRMKIDERTVQRRKRQLPNAVKQVCPACCNPMWVREDGVVEPHVGAESDGFYAQCSTSGKPQLQGLAAARPELYRWAWSA